MQDKVRRQMRATILFINEVPNDLETGKSFTLRPAQSTVAKYMEDRVARRHRFALDFALLDRTTVNP